MRAILVFNLPKEDNEFEVARNGWKYRRILQEVDTELRNKIKHGKYKDGVKKELQEVRDNLNQGIMDDGLELY